MEIHISGCRDNITFPVTSDARVLSAGVQASPLVAGQQGVPNSLEFSPVNSPSLLLSFPPGKGLVLLFPNSSGTVPSFTF